MKVAFSAIAGSSRFKKTDYVPSEDTISGEDLQIRTKVNLAVAPAVVRNLAK